MLAKVVAFGSMMLVLFIVVGGIEFVTTKAIRDGIKAGEAQRPTACHWTGIMKE